MAETEGERRVTEMERRAEIEAMFRLIEQPRMPVERYTPLRSEYYEVQPELRGRFEPVKKKESGIEKLLSILGMIGKYLTPKTIYERGGATKEEVARLPVTKF